MILSLIIILNFVGGTGMDMKKLAIFVLSVLAILAISLPAAAWWGVWAWPWAVWWW
jgi:hypothetical protein